MTPPDPPQPEPIRIIDLLDMARYQKWGEINAILPFLSVERLRRLADFLKARIGRETYKINGYYQWQRAMVDLLERVNSLIAAREARDDWSTLENTMI
jgi:hypothetical protein